MDGLDIISNRLFDGKRLQVSAIAQAQNYSEETLENYARAVLAIEPLRQETWQEIQRILNSQEIPSIACNSADSYEDLPSEARSLIVDYCNESKTIVEQNNLTVSEFNQITADVQSNDQLKQQVQAKMRELQ
ncbi:DUF4168 domain-containing protein [Halothece sp. PCC 7418]|uniref:DUF4168 domain-containing protein n=1 Tax=Halothece sp. (strain PCC 7418) TaxID=65093 RepID=UPI001C0A808F|nr:DUF4168 domain-containing protein [Halothece sp. PCC 7418]